MIRTAYHRNFSKQYAKLDTRTREHYIQRKNLFCEQPEHPLLDIHKLHGEWEGCSSFSVTGDIRVIFRSLAPTTIEFLAIGTHHQLYGK